MATLLLRLSAPMQSWGTRSKFTVRETEMEPSKSGVVGILCAALGKPRTEAVASGLPTLEQLASLTMAVRVDREGTLMEDYQTAGGGEFPHVKMYSAFTARGNNKKSADGTPVAVLSRRLYLADANFLVGLESNDMALLTRLQEALAKPAWPLYLGRKSFVPDLPVRILGGLVDLPLDAAMRQPKWVALHNGDHKAAKQAKKDERLTLRYVHEVDFGESDETRNDIPVSFESRVFAMRFVRTETIDLPADHIVIPRSSEEAIRCISRV